MLFCRKAKDGSQNTRDKQCGLGGWPGPHLFYRRQSEPLIQAQVTMRTTNRFQLLLASNILPKVTDTRQFPLVLPIFKSGIFE
jgi:hypothetical protein